MKEFDLFRDLLFDKPPPRVGVKDGFRSSIEVIGDDECGLYPTMTVESNLSDFLTISFEDEA